MPANVTVGIPTYNRPEGLRSALESIAKQTVLPAEVIISDNASNTEESAALTAEYRNYLPNLRYIRQTENIGACNNFLWLLGAACQPYFSWLADDDQWENKEYLAALHSRIQRDPSLLMVFPEVDVFFDNQRDIWARCIHAGKFGHCESDWDYMKAFSGYGGGHCFYGLYDREKLRALDPGRLWDPNWAYFAEGRYLHALFLHGGLRFEPGAKMRYNGTMATSISNKALLAAFMKYSIEVHKLYIQSNLSFFEKSSLLRNIAVKHYPYIWNLWIRSRRGS